MRSCVSADSGFGRAGAHPYRFFQLEGRILFYDLTQPSNFAEIGKSNTLITDRKYLAFASSHLQVRANETLSI